MSAGLGHVDRLRLSIKVWPKEELVECVVEHARSFVDFFSGQMSGGSGGADQGGQGNQHLTGSNTCSTGAMGSRRGLAPDTAVEISLHATALRVVRERASRGEVLEQLDAIAQGRRDLFGRAAGFLLDSYLASPGTTDPLMVEAAAALLAVGADPDAVRAKAEETRGRSIGGHVTPH